MVYGRYRRSFRKRRFVKRGRGFKRGRRFGRRRGGMRNYARRLISMAAEKKYQQYNIATVISNVANTWTEVEMVPGETIGSDQGKHIGDKWDITSVNIRLVFLHPSHPTAGDYYNRLRVVFGLWDFGAHAAKLSTDLPTHFSTGALDRPLYKELVPNLKLKMIDKRFIMQPQTIGSTFTGTSHKTITYSHKFKKPIHMVYMPGGYVNHTFWISMISDSSATPDPQLEAGYITYHYTDA